MRTIVNHMTYKKEIEEYLEGITYKEPLRDESGNIIKNLKGKEIEVYKYAIQPKVLDVLNRIDISSYHFYKQLKKDTDLQNVHEWFKDIIEAYLQEASLDSKSSTGARFQLGAYYNRSDKSNESVQDITIKMDSDISELAK